MNGNDPINGNTSRFGRRTIRTILAIITFLCASLATGIVYELVTGKQL